MGRIQSSIGLITGVPIADTVEQLISISARPRDLLISRTSNLQTQQLAVTELTALVIGLELATGKLGNAATFDKKQVTSSHPDLISATITGEPSTGTHQFTPLRLASSHQLVSNGVAAEDQPLGAGSFSFRFGGFVDESLRLEHLNGGQGIERGRIRITDRSGTSAIVDLRLAQTVDDVINAINGQEELNLTAVTTGDAIQLIDHTGQTVSNLIVQELGGGTTAASLGLAGIDVAASTATGQDVVRLYDALDLASLNDGNGISLQSGLADLAVSFRDGSSLEIDLGDPNSLAELVTTLNAADPARLSAAISADGDHLELTDLTSGASTFAVANTAGGSAATDLGLTGASSGSLVSSRRLVAGLKTSLLSTLNGGAGLGTLGQITLTDRSGAVTTIDLSTAETLDDVNNLINSAAGVGITAQVNSARNGLVLADTTGASAGNLIIASADATATAEALNIAVDAAVGSVDSGTLNRQVVHENLSLDSLNGGRGVAKGSFLITDSKGVTTAVNLIQSPIETIGDVIDKINSLTIGVDARLNDAGDGILLVDTAGGTGKIVVKESGTGSTAADLHLAGESIEVDIGGTLTKVIDGSTTARVVLDADDTLADLVEKINELDAGVSAGIINDGSASNPLRLSLVSDIPGSDGELLIDSGVIPLGLQEISAAQDALLLIGSLDSPGAGILASSSNNTFDSLIEGVSLTINDVSLTPVTVTVDTTDESLVSTVELFVEQYNKLQDKLEELTFFNEVDESTGVLFGSHETLRIESDLSRLLTDRFFGVGAIQSLEELGVSLNENGRMDLDKTRLKEKFASAPQAVEEFFSTEETGFAAKITALIDALAGEGDSLLIGRQEALQRKIDENNDRIEFMSSRLAAERDRLLIQFYNMELAIGKLQNSLSAISSLQPLPPLSSSSG